MKYLMLPLTLMLCACSSAEQDTRDEARDETVGAEIARDYNRQMQRAQDVEIQLEDKKRELDEAIEKSQ